MHYSYRARLCSAALLVLVSSLVAAAGPGPGPLPGAELETGLAQAMHLKKGTSERVGTSGQAIQAYMHAGLIDSKPNQRADYTDYYLLNKPARFMGHELVMIEEVAHNVHGDFYVEDGCCTSCDMPSTVAPELFSYAPDGHCYVSKQPSSAVEVRQMIKAFEVQDIGCIRYKGKNRLIQIKLVASGEGDQCDRLDQDLKVLINEVKRDRWD